jgi:pimeloyl-ACP methyl ester carboxylesterase
MSIQRAWWAALIGTAVVAWAAWLGAQDEKPVKPEPKTEKKTDKKAAKDELPPPEDQLLTAEDGLRLAFTYYPGTKGKESVPVVLLHAYKGSRKDFAGLAGLLQQSLGCAVVVPDLRGHGESTTLRFAKRDETLDAAKMSPKHFEMMARDMRAIKQFLWDKNNSGELNLDKLCVVGAEMGATLALVYAGDDAIGYDNDYHSPQVASLKLGRFLKAMVLISPEPTYKGLNTRLALAMPYVQAGPAVMVLVGKGNAKAKDDAKRIYSRFEKAHPVAPEDRKDQQTLFLGQFETSLQGTKLLEEKSLNIPEYIRAFIDQRLVKAPEAKTWVWKERKYPHQ